MSVQFEGCVHVCVYVCGCTYSGEQIGEHFYLTNFPFLSKEEIKRIFSIVTFDYHQIGHREQS